jgi:hypothetical protein
MLMLERKELVRGRIDDEAACDELLPEFLVRAVVGIAQDFQKGFFIRCRDRPEGSRFRIEKEKMIIIAIQEHIELGRLVALGFVHLSLPAVEF